MSGIDHRSHGGRTRELAAAAGLAEEELLDFSANLDPAGPPPWLGEAVAEGMRRITRYPDPDASLAREAAAARYGIPPELFLFADGADSLILALPRALNAASCVAASPTYSGYLRAALRARLPLRRVGLDPRKGFSQASPDFLAALDAELSAAPEPALAFLGAPNNPAGGSLPPGAVLELARRHPGAFLALDESFAELSGEERGLLGSGAANVIVLRSLTKTWAVPGARVGFAQAEPSLLASLRAELPAWPLSSFAEAIAVRALGDRDYASASAATVAREAGAFAEALADLPGMIAHRGSANFLLLELPSPKAGRSLAAGLLRRGVAVRRFSAEEGLDDRYLRVAVRGDSENAAFLEAARAALSEAAR